MSKTPPIDDGIILRGRVRRNAELSQAELNCVHSCVFTRFGLDTATRREQDQFRSLFPKEVEAWAKASISNGDIVHATDSVEEDRLDRRDATFVRVRKFSCRGQIPWS